MIQKCLVYTQCHHFEQQLDGAKICKFQLFMLCAYLCNKQVHFEIIACKTKTMFGCLSFQVMIMSL